MGAKSPIQTDIKAWWWVGAKSLFRTDGASEKDRNPSNEHLVGVINLVIY